jgi:hypothetical protein
VSETPKNEAPKRRDVPPFEGKLQIWLVAYPEDGPGMYRYVEKLQGGLGDHDRAAQIARLYERYPVLTRDADAEIRDRKRSR